MKVEFVEFYPTMGIKRGRKGRSIVGTVHVYLPEMGLNIRGIEVTHKGNNTCFYFRMPHFRGVDTETGVYIYYPHIDFDNNTIQEIINFLKSEVTPVLKSRFSISKQTK